MTEPYRVLAIASGGGHWVQLLRLRLAWDGCAVTYVTTTGAFRDEILRDAEERSQLVPRYLVVPEANRWQKRRLIKQLFMLIWIVMRTRPHAIITTGAAPGYFAIRLGKLIGAKCAWIDSVANAKELSFSGRAAGPHADLWVTQWKDLAEPGGPEYHGSVL